MPDERIEPLNDSVPDGTYVFDFVNGRAYVLHNATGGNDDAPSTRRKRTDTDDAE